MQFNDGQLLARFIQNQDESAFEDLVKRHATMVIAACRMILENVRDAEEAFQNTFMVLAGKAHQHTGKKSINGWLYRVAVWKALNIRSKRSVQVRYIVERKDAEMIAEQEPGSATALESMKGLLAEELNRLADKYSLPLILCYLEGKSTEQAAHDLGLSDSALKVRLMRGRELLRKRLVRRGMTVSAGTLATVLLEQSAKTAEIVPEVLIQSTVKAATALLSTAAGVTGTLTGLKLMKGVLLAMTMKKTALIIGGLVLLGLIGSIFYLSKPAQKSAPVQESKQILQENQELPAISNNCMSNLSETLTAQTGLVEKIGNPGKETLPVSAKDYYSRFKEALNANGNERWEILRGLGIDLTDAEFEAAWQTAQNDTRFKDLTCLFGVPFFSGEEAALFLKLQDAVFSKWVEKDPLAVIEWAKKLPEGKNYYVSFDKERILRTSPSPRSKEGFITALVALWAKNDMDVAVKWANEQPVGMDRETAQLGLAVAMSCKDAKGAMELVEKENLLLRKQGKIYSEISYIFSNWALANPVEAVNYLKALPSGDFNDVLKNDWGMYSVGYQWAKTDLKGALDWAEKLSGAEKKCLMGGITREWAREDFNAAKDYVTSMWERQAGGVNNGMLWDLACVWLEKDPQACAEWAMQLTSKDSGSKESLCKFISQQWAHKDHKAAFNWIEQLPQGESSETMWKAAANGMVDGMVVNNELSSFKEGINLIDENFSEGDIRQSLYAHLMGMWGQRDSLDNEDKEITDWIKTLPGGKDKDDILSRFCREQSYIQKMSYSDLIQLASGMQDEKRRQDAYEGIFGRWIREDSATAKQWLQNSAFPQSVKDKLLAGK